MGQGTNLCLFSLALIKLPFSFSCESLQIFSFLEFRQNFAFPHHKYRTTVRR